MERHVPGWRDGEHRAVIGLFGRSGASHRETRDLENRLDEPPSERGSPPGFGTPSGATAACLFAAIRPVYFYNHLTPRTELARDDCISKEPRYARQSNRKPNLLSSRGREPADGHVERAYRAFEQQTQKSRRGGSGRQLTSESTSRPFYCLFCDAGHLMVTNSDDATESDPPVGDLPNHARRTSRGGSNSSRRCPGRSPTWAGGKRRVQTRCAGPPLAHGPGGPTENRSSCGADDEITERAQG